MSLTLKTLKAGPERNQASDSDGVGQPDLVGNEVICACNQTALEMATESIVFFSAVSSRLIHANKAACHCLGYTRQQLGRLSLSDIAPQATRASLAELFTSALKNKDQGTRLRTAYRHRSGSMIPVRCSIRALPTGPEGILVAVAHDTSAHRSLKFRRSIADFRDGLTLLPNRTWLWRRLEREIRVANRSDYQFAVLFVDIDRFKEINDSYGHLAGDQVLQTVAHQLAASIRPIDAVTRYGGDEFVVLLKDVRSEMDIHEIVKRISRRFEAAGQHRGSKPWRARVTASVGAAICGGQSATFVDALERADRAMYRAKALGRNGQFIIDDLPGIVSVREKTARHGPNRTKKRDERN